MFLKTKEKGLKRDHLPVLVVLRWNFHDAKLALLNTVITPLLNRHEHTQTGHFNPKTKKPFQPYTLAENLRSLEIQKCEHLTVDLGAQSK